MAITKDANYDQLYLFPPALEDLVPPDHPARFIRELVDCLDLAALHFSERQSQQGGFNYSTKLYLRVWLFGWLNRIRSSRELERATYENVGMMWLAGMHHPDHNSLWRFFRDNKKQLRHLFQTVVRVAVTSGLVDFVLHAVDGTKIKANAHRDKLILLKDITTILKHLDAVADQVIVETEAQANPSSARTSLPTSLQDRAELQKIIKQSLAELKKESPQLTLAPEKERALRDVATDLAQKKATFLSVSDGDTRMMKCSGQMTFGYNAQTVVEQSHALIVAAEVLSENSDNHALVPMIDQVKATTGHNASETVADAGYFSGEQLQSAEEKGYAIVVSERRDATEGTDFHRSQFHYDPSKDGFYCPLGSFLPYGRQNRKKNKGLRVYRCRDYATCPERARCCQGKKGRSITRSDQSDYLERHRIKMSTAEIQALVRKRKVIAEPPFHVVKNILGFKQWTVRGLENVRAQWQLLCTVYNIKKLWALWRTGMFRLPDKVGV